MVCLPGKVERLIKELVTPKGHGGTERLVYFAKFLWISSKVKWSQIFPIPTIPAHSWSRGLYPANLVAGNSARNITTCWRQNSVTYFQNGEIVCSLVATAVAGIRRQEPIVTSKRHLRDGRKRGINNKKDKYNVT